MKYRLKLRCEVCGKESGYKEYDVDQNAMQKIVNACMSALIHPQYLICPQCESIFSVKPVIQKERNNE